MLGTIDVSIVESFVYRLAQELQTRLEAVRAAGMCEVTSSPASHSQKDTLTGVARLAGHLLLLLHTRQQPVAAALLDTLLGQARALLQLCADSTRAPDAQVQAFGYLFVNHSSGNRERMIEIVLNDAAERVGGCGA